MSDFKEASRFYEREKDDDLELVSLHALKTQIEDLVKHEKYSDALKQLQVLERKVDSIRSRSFDTRIMLAGLREEIALLKEALLKLQ